MRWLLIPETLRRPEASRGTRYALPAQTGRLSKYHNLTSNVETKRLRGGAVVRLVDGHLNNYPLSFSGVLTPKCQSSINWGIPGKTVLSHQELPLSGLRCNCQRPASSLKRHQSFGEAGCRADAPKRSHLNLSVQQRPTASPQL